ncbi:OmpA family protein [Spongiivirga citrea]|uniref:OmpA family protein n=1 Tax=Spongiivirga citrea TaxID=1481457 RepID=A0A6M0CKN0_9FLAO|nr:OmpA family protein [Spongiivirga citrea]NER16409.1 OmpA family protein [Spongiivirga citrea]
MKNFLLAFIIFLGWSILGIWYYTCKTKNLCIERTNPVKEVISTPVEEIQPGFSVSADNGSTLFEFNDQLEINNRNTSVYVPDALLCYRDSIFSYLNNNQDKELLIQGLYKNQETDSLGSFGIQRAENIKNMLVDHGINAERISTEAVQEVYDYDETGTYAGGIKIIVNTVSDNRTAEIEKSITRKTLYADFGSANFKPDNTLKAYTIELKNYLERNPEKNVDIIGHTDDVGSAEANFIVGRNRALNVKNYFISQGIAADKITSDSKGETQPIATNGNEAGRAKNRRIEILVN